MQQALGTPLYTKICDLIISNDIENSTYSRYKTLLSDYIRPAHAYHTFAEAIVYIRFKFMNKSVSGENSDNSTPVDLDELKYIKDQITNKAEFLTERLIEYLCDNSTYWPEYTTASDDIVASKTGYYSGMNLDDDGCRFCNFN